MLCRWRRDGLAHTTIVVLFGLFTDTSYAQACGAPPDVENANYTSTGGPFPIVTYQCNDGYVLVTGSVDIACQEENNNTYVGDLPLCERVFDCTAPPALKAGSGAVHYNRTTDGSTANYTCSDGYINIGPSYLSCVNGTWIPEESPNCTAEVFDCTAPPALKGGSGVVDYDTTTDGSTANYTCSNGYINRGPSYLSCVNGTWIPEESPNCIASVFDCIAPPALKGGSGVVYYDTMTDGSTVNYTCSDGYINRGPSYLSCVNGTWIPEKSPNCTDMDECLMGEHRCFLNATCENTIGNYTCTCNSGFSGNGFDCNHGTTSTSVSVAVVVSVSLSSLLIVVLIAVAYVKRKRKAYILIRADRTGATRETLSRYPLEIAMTENAAYGIVVGQPSTGGNPYSDITEKTESPAYSIVRVPLCTNRPASA